MDQRLAEGEALLRRHVLLEGDRQGYVADGRGSVPGRGAAAQFLYYDADWEAALLDVGVAAGHGEPTAGSRRDGAGRGRAVAPPDRCREVGDGTGRVTDGEAGNRAGEDSPFTGADRHADRREGHGHDGDCLAARDRTELEGTPGGVGVDVAHPDEVPANVLEQDLELVHALVGRRERVVQRRQLVDAPGGMPEGHVARVARYRHALLVHRRDRERLGCALGRIGEPGQDKPGRTHAHVPRPSRVVAAGIPCRIAGHHAPEVGDVDVVAAGEVEADREAAV